ncbi:MAG: transporter [Alphaproteobacteria bacterium]|nr:transporter [Alphaproteobacteria bacterium]
MSSVYKIIEIIGVSKKGWEDAAREAMTAAAATLRELRVAEVKDMDVTLKENGEIDMFRTKLAVSFKYEKD